MIINHNLSSMGANRYKKINDANKTRSSMKLGSGYKINSASDNAAGLSISEKMRSQIRGLTQAAVNSQDGISLIQTAEGALSEDHSLLQRIRELTVQAANDTNADFDRQAIQEEIGQLSNELDRIASQTEFNTKKLLDGSLSSSVNSDALTKLMENLKGTWLNDAFQQIKNTTGLTLNNDANLIVEFKDLGTSTVASMGSWKGGSTFYLNINTNFLTDNTLYDESGPVAGGILFDRLITHEAMHAVMNHNASPAMNFPMWFSEGLAEAVHGASDIRFWEGVASPSDSENYAETIMSEFNFADNETGYNAYPAGYLAISYLYNYHNDGGTTFKNMLADMDTFTDFEAMVSARFGKTYDTLLSDMQTAASTDIHDFLVNKCKIDLSDGKADAIGVADALSKDMIDQNGSSAPITADIETIPIDTNILTIDWPDISSLTPFRLQVGANANQLVTIAIGNMSSDALLGSTGISVLSHSGATKSLSILDDAIEKVSSQRSSLGAMHNRLEHIIANLNSTSENTTSAESRIRDVDIAEEMVNYSKYNILQQASQAMIAQANKQPEGILQLLN